MATRVNATSMATPDPYGNMFGSMVPTGTIKPTTELKGKKSPVQTAVNPYDIVEQAQQSVEKLRPPKIEKPKVDLVNPDDITKAAANVGSTVANTLKEGGTKKDAAVSGGVALGAAAAGIGGQALENNKNEIAGGALKGAGTGASLGANPALIAATGGLSILAGAGIGAAVGTVSGAIKRKKRIGQEMRDERNQNAQNIQFKNLQNKTIGQAEDLAAYKGLISQNKNGGTIKYKKGGILKFGQVNVKEAENYLKEVQKERDLENNKTLNEVPMFQLGGKMDAAAQEKQKQLMVSAFKMHQKGASVAEISKKLKLKPEQTKKIITYFQKKLKDKKTNNSQPSMNQGFTTTNTVNQFEKGGSIKKEKVKFYKKGKVLKCKKGCKGCANCKKSDGKITMALLFRRGGKVDLEKQNVIIDGPSHDEYNNTGVKGDKGLPVVQNGKKIAEIESDELVINDVSVSKIEALRERIKRGDSKAKEELAEILHAELAENTYSYSDTHKI